MASGMFIKSVYFCLSFIHLLIHSFIHLLQAQPPEVKDAAGMVTFHWLPPSTPPLPILEGSGQQQQGQQRRSHASGSPHEVRVHAFGVLIKLVMHSCIV